MNQLEMMEKLREKAGVSLEDAKAALEASKWDLLDAYTFLQHQGRIKEADDRQRWADTLQRIAESDFGQGVQRIWKFLRMLVRKGNVHAFVISNRKREEMMAMPVTVLALLMIGFWPWGWVALIAGLFLGGRYAFRGPDMGKRVNDAMDKAADMAQGLDEKKKE
ncbi:MAG: DUF4342 domain-containing protein [Clostridiales bacterium]|nr:DUF4342 domain-containing protein [Clostridiales bacterium]